MFNLINKFDNYIYRFPYRKYMYKNKCVFIHIPKTAGTSIREALGAPLTPRDHYDYRMYLQSDSGKFNSYFKFAFVRDPWARLYSTYNYLSRGGNQSGDLDFYKKNEQYFKDFKSFVKVFLTPSNISKIVLLRTQASFILDKDDSLMVDFVGKVENIQDDFEFIAKKLQLNPQLGKLNESVKTDYRKQYDTELVELVEKVYYDDVKNFDYKFE